MVFQSPLRQNPHLNCAFILVAFILQYCNISSNIEHRDTLANKFITKLVFFNEKVTSILSLQDTENHSSRHLCCSLTYCPVSISPLGSSDKVF